jgi:hypothetical protein
MTGTLASKQKFLSAVIIVYKERRQRNHQTCGGNGHLGVTMKELETHFTRRFKDSSDLISVLNKMLSTDKIVAIQRTKRIVGQGNDVSESPQSTIDIRILSSIPEDLSADQGQLRFYHPNYLPRGIVYAQQIVLKEDNIYDAIVTHASSE